MPDPFAKVRAGDAFRIPAEAYNAFIDGVTLDRRRPAIAPRPLPIEPATPSTIKIQNKSGGDLARFAVLVVGDPVFDADDNLAEFQNNVVYEGNTPGDQADWPIVAIITQALVADAIGRAVILGEATVKVDVSSGQTQWRHVKVANGVTARLAMSDTPACGRVLWKQSGTGTKWAKVLLNPHTAGFWGIVGCRRDAGGTWQYAFTEAIWDDETDTPPIAKPGGRVGYTAQSALAERTTTGTASAAEVQLITFCGPPTESGSYTIAGSSSIAHNSDAAAVQTAVRTALGGTLVTVSGSFASGFTVTWPANGAQSLLTVDVSALSPAGPVTAAYEVNNQKVKPGVVAWFEYDWEFHCYRFAVPFKACGGIELPGFVAGRKNWVYVDSDGCWKVVPGNTDCA